MLVCDCGTTNHRHDYGCNGWREPSTPPATFPSWALEARTDTDCRGVGLHAASPTPTDRRRPDDED